MDVLRVENDKLVVSVEQKLDINEIQKQIAEAQRDVFNYTNTLNGIQAKIDAAQAKVDELTALVKPAEDAAVAYAGSIKPVEPIKEEPVEPVEGVNP